MGRCLQRVSIALDKPLEERRTNLTLNKSETEMLVSTTMPPPPIPWSARPASIMARLTDNAQIKLAIRKMKLASKIMYFLPQISLTLPQRGMQEALARRYDEAIHE